MAVSGTRSAWTLALGLLLALAGLPPAARAADDHPAFPDADKGADPAVPAKLGGKGFAQVAASLGYQTSTDFPLLGDPSAKKGGELCRPVSDYPSNFRPAGPQANTSFNGLAGGLMFESLLILHSNTTEWVPSLASHWMRSKDGMTFRYRLNPNARWADGSPVTTEDVIQSYRLRTDDSFGAPSTIYTYRKFEEPKALSKYLLEVQCKTRNWRNFLYFSGMLIFPAKDLKPFDGKASEWVKAYNTKFMMPSGPYEMRAEDQKKGISMMLRRRKDYWAANHRQTAGLFNFDRIKRVVITDRKIAFERLKKGDEGDINLMAVSTARRWVVEMTPKRIDTMARGLLQKRKIFNEQPQGAYGIAFNMNKAPYSDVRVRKALALLLDRKRLIKELMFRQYLPIRSYWPGTEYENPKNPKNKVDPRTALKLLADAGWKTRNNTGQLVDAKGDPLTVRLTYASPGLEKHLTMYQESLRKAGVTLSLELTRGEQLWQQIMEKKYGMAVMSWGALLFPNPESSYRSKYAKLPNNNNITGVADPRIDELIEAYDKLDLEDRAKRIEIVQEIDGILAKLYPYALFWYGPYARLIFWNDFGHPAWGLSRTASSLDVDQSWWWDPEKAALVEKGRADPSVKLPIGRTSVRYWRQKRKAAQEGAKKNASPGG